MHINEGELRAAVITTAVAKKTGPITEAGKNEASALEECNGELQGQKSDTDAAGNVRVLWWSRIIDTIVRASTAPAGTRHAEAAPCVWDDRRLPLGPYSLRQGPEGLRE